MYISDAQVVQVVGGIYHICIDLAGKGRTILTTDPSGGSLDVIVSDDREAIVMVQGLRAIANQLEMAVRRGGEIERVIRTTAMPPITMRRDNGGGR